MGYLSKMKMGNIKAIRMEIYYKPEWMISKFKGARTSTKVFIVLSFGSSAATALYNLFKNVWGWQKNQNKMFTEDTAARRELIGSNVAQGLACSHYYGYLRYVLPDLQANIEKSDGYKKLSSEDKMHIPMKLYELIPRKYNVDIQETDDCIEFVSDVTIETNSEYPAGDTNKIKMYSIKDGAKKYYCVCHCPDVLKTINDMYDMQLAGIFSSKVQSFNVDTKLVQLMRFYYRMFTLLCHEFPENNFGENARLILFNESVEKPSKVLLQAIKKDLKKPTSQQNEQLSTLLTTEEKKDVVYDFDVFVSHSEDIQDKQALHEIESALQKKKMNILLEKKCVGADWLSKLKYAASKCRWLVLLNTKESKSKHFMPCQVVDSLKSILQSKNVQTVAVVNTMDELDIQDDLRWVTCILNDDKLIETLHNVLCGLKVNQKSSSTCIKPGEVAVGLAWHHVVNHFCKGLPDKREYAVGVLHKMNEDKLFNEKQMKMEIDNFNTTVDKIVEILLQKKSAEDSERVHTNDNVSH